MQPNHNRTPGQADEQDVPSAGDDAFDPGDSFSNEPSDQSGAGALPSWLQNFADATGEAGDTGAPKAPATAAPQPELSSWDDPTAAPQAAAPAQPEPADPFGQAPAAADANFFSEDDLPEWLRALSTEGETAPVAVPVAAGPTTSPAPNGTLNVPPISRAWVTAADQAEVSPSANLLSSLVHVIDSRPDAVAVEAPPVASAPPQNARATPAPQPAATAAPVASEPAQAAKGRNRTQLLLIGVIAALVLLIILMQVLN